MGGEVWGWGGWEDTQKGRGILDQPPSDAHSEEGPPFVLRLDSAAGEAELVSNFESIVAQLAASAEIKAAADEAERRDTEAKVRGAHPRPHTRPRPALALARSLTLSPLALTHIGRCVPHTESTWP